jgi:uridine kinase
VLNLDDFYKDGHDPTLPRSPTGAADWDDPRSWLLSDALQAIESLCRTGQADVPVYDIATDRRVGRHALDLQGSAYFVAEGIFAQEVVAECAGRCLLADAVCVRHHRLVTFWRRLTRDLKEHRKPPHVLLRRGVLLLLAEPRVVAHAVALGCAPMTPHHAYRRIVSLTGSVPPAPRGRRTPA